jgi:radical SAM protein with 4Fe4S-binding SPASM domain
MSHRGTSAGAPGQRPTTNHQPPTTFNHAPVIAIWEVTRACDLVCQHCRAEATPLPAPDELTTAEARALMDRVRSAFGPILFVLTGGDPLKRGDLLELVRHGAALGLGMAITPSATPLLTTEAIAALHEAGIKRMAVSLDGADQPTHDRFRGVQGTWERTLAALQIAKQRGLDAQINTSVGHHNTGQLREIAALGAWYGISQWSVFLLVPTGRAGAEDIVSAADHERVYRTLASIADDPATPFAIKTTAGQPFYRVRAQSAARRPAGPPPRFAGVNDGNGFVFISHTGEICPSGFLPLVAGNVRTHDLAEVYRHDPLFTRLRQPETFTGKCGACEYNVICGGSRSRTWALTGDAFASDPTCVYVPPASGPTLGARPARPLGKSVIQP